MSSVGHVRRLARVGLFAATTSVLTLALVEVALAVMLAFPVRRAPWLPLIRDLYIGVERDIIQYNPVGARWDPELFYTLRPGRFVFAQREFRHEFRVNRLGLRDEESALRAPEIIVLGDSFTMGWGVTQEAAYPTLIGAATGRRTLNAAIASYGTVRQMLLFARLDTSRLRVLVVQYNGDDFFENLAYWRAGNVHVSRDEAHWDRTAGRVAARRRYYPGKHVWDAGHRLVRRMTPRPSRAAAAAAPAAADLFLNALARVPHGSLDGVQIVVWEMPHSGVVSVLRQRLERGVYPPALRNMQLVDIASALDVDRDFWVLDDHLNASGHRVVADHLIEALR